MEYPFGPSIEDTVDSAKNFLVHRDGRLVQLEDLLKPGYSGCNMCPLRARGDPLTDTGEPNPIFIPPKCAFYEEGQHCVVEEALVIETVQTFKQEGLGNLDKFTIFSLLNSMLNLHRLSRVGQVINFSAAHLNKDTADIINKYIAMTASTNNQYVKALKEMLATRKDQTTLKLQKTNAAGAIARSIMEAQRLKSAEAKKHERSSNT